MPHTTPDTLELTPMALTCNQLLDRHAQAWTAATVHPFLEQCHAGTIQPQQFNTWLVQDYLFVIEFTRMQAQVIRTAPAHHFDTLLAGMVAIKDEMNWFKAKAEERKLSLDTPRQATCEEYCYFMGSLASLAYPAQAVALWAIELAYNQGWQKPGAMPEPYTEFGDRWGNPGFTDYVKVLATQADEVLESASTTVQHQAEAVFLQVARLEEAFWQMAFNAI